jgi:hypothetical protein
VVRIRCHQSHPRQLFGTGFANHCQLSSSGFANRFHGFPQEIFGVRTNSGKLDGQYAVRTYLFMCDGALTTVAVATMLQSEHMFRRPEWTKTFKSHLVPERFN